MTKRDVASTWFSGGFNCSQSVVAAFAEEYGLEPGLALRVAGAFGGGMARSGQTCGAVTGALMAIGLKYGKTRGDDTAAGERCTAVAAEFIRCFQERHGALTCPALVEQNQCAQLVADAAEIVEELLQ